MSTRNHFQKEVIVQLSWVVVTIQAEKHVRISRNILKILALGGVQIFFLLRGLVTSLFFLTLIKLGGHSN